MTPRVLVIAGSDSSGGAGIQADIKTITMLGGHAMTAITALTAQNTCGVHAVEAVSPDMVAAQIDACLGDIGADAVKIGMLGSPDIAGVVADRLDGLGLPVVFDPVMVATSGSVLADAATIAAFERLMRLATVTTPNTDELGILAGFPIESEIHLRLAVEQVMAETGSRAILAKGGHLIIEGETHGRNPDGSAYRFENSTMVFDFLFERGNEFPVEQYWNAPRIHTTSTHGTGCTMASAIATHLAQGSGLPDAVAKARLFVRAALEAAPGLGRGHGPLGQQAVR